MKIVHPQIRPIYAPFCTLLKLDHLYILNQLISGYVNFI